MRVFANIHFGKIAKDFILNIRYFFFDLTGGEMVCPKCGYFVRKDKVTKDGCPKCKDNKSSWRCG